MKKIIIAMMAVIGVSSMACARDTYVHSASVLPKTAQTVLAKFFPGKVSLVKIDKDLGFVDDYTVTMADGSEVTFDRNGNWETIEVLPGRQVPNGLTPRLVAEYVRSNHKGLNIVGLDRDRKGYDVELTNGIELKFDKNGRFIRYDN